MNSNQELIKLMEGLGLSKDPDWVDDDGNVQQDLIFDWVNVNGDDDDVVADELAQKILNEVKKAELRGWLDGELFGELKVAFENCDGNYHAIIEDKRSQLQTLEQEEK